MLDSGQLRNHIESLVNGDDGSKREALQSIKQIDEKEWASAPATLVQPLIHALAPHLTSGGKQSHFRQEAIAILGKMGPKAEPAVPQLIELLAAGVANGVRDAAATTLGKIGKKAAPAVEPLVALLQNSPTGLVVRVVRALGEIGSVNEQGRSALLKLWLTPSQSQTGQVQVALALIKLQIPAPGVLAYLTSTTVASLDSSLRAAATEALANCDRNAPDVVPALLAATLNDKDEKVRLSAQASLDRLRLTTADAALVCVDQLCRSTYAETALRNGGRLAVAALTTALRADDPLVREKAARTLSGLGESAVDAAAELANALHDKDPNVALAAAKALWGITKQADLVVPVLAGLLKARPAGDPDAAESRRRFVQTVMEALRRIGRSASGAAAALKEMTKDANRHIRESALSALKETMPEPEKTASKTRGSPSTTRAH